MSATVSDFEIEIVERVNDGEGYPIRDWSKSFDTELELRSAVAKAGDGFDGVAAFLSGEA